MRAFSDEPCRRWRGRRVAVLAGGLLAGAIGASAAAAAGDLPAEPVAVGYVRICDAYGRGYFVIPGTDTCYRISGTVAAEWHVFGGDRASRQPGFYGNEDASVGYVKAIQVWSSATNTEFGLLRSHVEIEYVDTATYGGLVGDMKWAYVEVGGLTFGRLQSPFDFITGTTYADIYEPAWSDRQNNVVAYTATLGKGWSATLSVEDNAYRRVGIIGGGGGSGYAGTRLPDLVAGLSWDGEANQAKIMAALHEVRARRGGAAQTGWVVAAGAVLDASFIAESDQIMVQASIGQGALNYVATNPIGPGRDFAGADGRLTGNRRLVLADTWAIAGVFDHYWNEQWVSRLNGSFLEVDQAGRRFDFRNIDAQLNLSYAPVDDLKFTAEAEYKYIARTEGRDGNAFVMMFVVERDF